MKRGATYPITITVPIDLTNADWVIVSFKPKDSPKFEFERDEMSIAYANGESAIVIHLTEEQSVAIEPGSVKVDLNYSIDGVRDGAKPEMYDVTETLLDRAVGNNG